MSDEHVPLAAPQGATVSRSPMRRAVLAVVVVGVVAAIAICLFVLDGFAARLTTGANAGGSSSAELADCNTLYPEWTDAWVQGQLAAIRDAKGDDANGVAAPWRTPEHFPSAAIAWSGIVPVCGSTMVVDVDDSAWTYRMDVTEVTETQFAAASNLLAAMGYSLTYDQVPHDLLQVGEVAPDTTDSESEDGQSDGDTTEADGSTAASWYREFANADGWVWMTFFPNDPNAEVPVGELVIGYQTAD